MWICKQQNSFKCEHFGIFSSFKEKRYKFYLLVSAVSGKTYNDIENVYAEVVSNVSDEAQKTAWDKRGLFWGGDISVIYPAIVYFGFYRSGGAHCRGHSYSRKT